MSTPIVSSFEHAADVANPRDFPVRALLDTIRSGGKKLKGQITQIRNRFQAELAITGDRKKAKLAVDALKKQLPGVTPSGRFKKRANDALIEYTGLLCTDIDSLGERLLAVRKKLKASPYVVAVFLSPTGDGLKVWFRVAPDPAKHLASFRAIQKHVRELTGAKIDESCKDVSRLCFLSYDPDLYYHQDALEIEPLPEPEKPKGAANGAVNLSERQRIATELLGNIEWESETSGFVPCPAKHLHITGDSDRDCKIDFDHVPTLHCFHDHCRAILEAINRELRSRIGKAEYQARHEPPHVDVKETEPVELPPPPAPYTPPPLTLLPAVVQDYIHTAAESLNVDVAFILLPFLSSLGTAIGNSRSIILKHGFIQPPVVWTGIVGRSGSRKSPSGQESCSPILAHERELMRQNSETQEIYAEELAQWEKSKGKRGKPEKPTFLACRCDDLTIEVLADILATNPRGVLVWKDELSHWIGSFDQYKNVKGSDVSRWLSLHTAVSLAVDRRTDSRHYRIVNPRVNLSGGIQPKILRRELTPDFFDRGLPARFIFAYPPFRKDKWSEAIVTDNIRDAVLNLFEKLWLLQPKDGNPVLLSLDKDARAIFIDFYNRCGESASQANERDEAAWGKLSGGGGRVALISQLLHNSHAEFITGAIMEAACTFALWAGNEASRIYADLSETTWQREQRELIEFIVKRGGSVTVRDVTHYYWPLKGQTEQAEWRLNALVKASFGKWDNIRPSGRGKFIRVFQLLPASPSPTDLSYEGETPFIGDGDVPSSQKIMADEKGIGKV